MPKRDESRRIRFNKTNLAALEPPATGRVYWSDTLTPGLKLAITANGIKTFYFVRKWNGKPERTRLGSFPEMTVDKARDKATNTYIDGKSPHQERKKTRQKHKAEWTLQDLFEWYHENHAAIHKRTAKLDRDQFDRYAKPLANRKLSTITTEDVRKLHATIGTKNGKYAANRFRSLLHTMYSLAGREGHWKGENPAANVKPFKEQSRERFLYPEEMPKFFEALDAEPSDTIRDYFWTLLFCGARRSNVLSMRWEELNLDRATWTIPGDKFKNGEAQVIHLPDVLVEIIRRRKEEGEQTAIEKRQEPSPWVFPSSRSDSKLGHLGDPAKGWERLLERAGFSDLRLHDLRRSLGSWMAAGGSSLQIIGKHLGHRDISTTQIYSRLALDPIRLSVDAAVNAILAAGRPDKDKNTGETDATGEG